MFTDWTNVVARVKRALRRRGCLEQDAEDLVQEAFIRLACYQRQHVVDAPEAFLMKAAINLSTDAYRSRARHGEELLHEDLALTDPAPSTEDVQVSRERLRRLSICVARLNDKTRTIFLAHRLDGLTYQEIGHMHRLSISTVEKHVAKATLRVAAWMEGWYP